MLAWLIGIMMGCEQAPQIESSYFPYGSKSDSAVYYFRLGWQQILDNGQWTRSEQSFRKAVEIDSTFLVGWSLVGRISQDYQERKAILDMIDNAAETSEAQALLLEIFRSNIKLMNDREEGISTPEQRRAHFGLAERNYRRFLDQYPHESYMLAEYIEVLHANYGPEVALDSLKMLPTESQAGLLFFEAYTAHLEKELGNPEKAIAIASEMSRTVSGDTIPARPYVLADIYFAMGRYDEALASVEEALRRDPNHLIARSLEGRIRKAIDDARRE